MNLEEMEGQKCPHGAVTLVGLGRLGLRTAMNLVQVHRGGPDTLTVIDGQRISEDDILFRMYGGNPGEYKVDFFKKFAGSVTSRNITTIPHHISEKNLSSVSGNVVCIEIAGGDTLPITASIIHHIHKQGGFTISTMGVFGIGNEPIYTTDIRDADPNNPIIAILSSMGVKNHLLVGTGKLIRDWEPVTPYVLDRISQVITAEILKKLYNNVNSNSNS